MFELAFTYIYIYLKIYLIFENLDVGDVFVVIATPKNYEHVP